MNYIFDIDGTLTDPQEKIDPSFEEFFYNWCRDHTVFLVTGNDIDQIKKQITPRILEIVMSHYYCSGNVQYVGDTLVYQNDIGDIDQLHVFLVDLLAANSYPFKTDNHIDIRPGMVNFSILGRKSTLFQRKEYILWDNFSGERKKLKSMIEAKFGDEFDISIGGEISIDIYRKGCDKSQILKTIDGPCAFFGDKIKEGGNDYAIAKAVEIAYSVDGWGDTLEILKRIKELGL